MPAGGFRIFIGILGRKVVAHRCQHGVGTFESDAGREAAEHVEILAASSGRVGFRAECQRYPHLRGGIGEIEIRRHYTNDLVRHGVELDRSAYDFRVSSEPASPEGIAQQNCFRCAKAILLGKECTSEMRRSSKHGEQARGCIDDVHVLRVV